MYGLPLEGGQLRENGLSLSQKLATANSFVAWGGIVCLTPLTMLGFGLARACVGSAHVVPTAMSSYVQLCFCPEDNVSL